jgi:hypothetical protein
VVVALHLRPSEEGSHVEVAVDGIHKVASEALEEDAQRKKTAVGVVDPAEGLLESN